MRDKVWLFCDYDGPPEFEFLQNLSWPIGEELDEGYLGRKVYIHCDYSFTEYRDGRPNDDYRIIEIRVWDDDERTAWGKSWQEVSRRYLELLRKDRYLAIAPPILDRPKETWLERIRHRVGKGIEEGTTEAHQRQIVPADVRFSRGTGHRSPEK